MKTFLIADDMAQNRKLFRIILEDQFPDCTVLEAENGVAALEMAQSRKPGLILMDVRMPEMDGLTATKKLKQDAETAAIPVVIVTSSVGGDTLDKLLMECGADGYICKPIKILPFVEQIRNLVGE